MQTKTRVCVTEEDRERSAAPQEVTDVFAAGLCREKLFWLFMVGCVVGVMVETLYCLMNTHTLQNRAGVLYGPFNPVYGVGAMVMTLGLHRTQRKGAAAIFAGSALIGGAFEYAISFLQESVFGTVSWDYSYMPLNINGRTNVLYMVFWGFLGVLWMKHAYPFISTQIERIPKKWGKLLTVVLAVFMLFDMSLSALAVSRQAERRTGIPPSSRLEVFLDQQYPDEYLEEAFPSMAVVENTVSSRPAE